MYKTFKALPRNQRRRLIPNSGNVVRAANRARQGLRPKTPTTLDFSFDLNHIPERFLRKDIRWVDGKGCLQRVVIFATGRQLNNLARAKR